MTIEADQAVKLHAVRIGDRGRSARGWLIVADGAIRGILSAGEDGQVLFAFACDRRIAPEGGLMIFRDLEEAYAWVERRLPERPPSRSRGRPRAIDEDEDDVTALTRADAERALIGAAMDYCWSIRNRSLPDEGPLRRLWTAFVNYRRVTGPARSAVV